MNFPQDFPQEFEASYQLISSSMKEAQKLHKTLGFRKRVEAFALLASLNSPANRKKLLLVLAFYGLFKMKINKDMAYRIMLKILSRDT